MNALIAPIVAVVFIAWVNLPGLYPKAETEPQKSFYGAVFYGGLDGNFNDSEFRWRVKI
jgi:hypothetical protein